MNPNIEKVIEQIQPLRDELKNHELYKSLNSIEDIKIFMESHVEMNGWPKLDGNIILYLEIVLLICVFTMNGAYFL